jgi:hypothetical protein
MHLGVQPRIEAWTCGTASLGPAQYVELLEARAVSPTKPFGHAADKNFIFASIQVRLSFVRGGGNLIMGVCC